MSGSTPPDFLTVMEAGRILRLGRSRAYDEARLYERTNGAEGLIPVKRAGRIFRVPRALLEEVAGGPIQLDLDLEPATTAERSTDDEQSSGTETEPDQAEHADPSDDDSTETVTRQSARRRSRRHDTDALQLFPTD